MKSPIKFAFFMAMPLEAANMYFRGFSFAHGILVGGVSLGALLNDQFEIIHWPGLRASDWFDSIGFPQIGLMATVASGYVDTILLLLAAIVVFGWLRGGGARRPPKLDEPEAE